jgi:L-seryl-tRNA(Ser) seleniumtransferase
MVTHVDDLAQPAPRDPSRKVLDSALLRKIPRTDQLLADPRMRLAERRVGRDLVKAAITRAQERARRAEITPDQVADAAAAELPSIAASLTPVINATGVLVHTNLGRAPLSQAAQEAVTAASGTCDVEFDLETGARARQRGQGAIEALRRAVPAAQAAGVVNNNAAALVLAATALAAGQEIIISRGELIEIGDRFRLPDLLESTGARLKEVGTTNRTSVGDYQQAITADTGFILKVHPSNYRVAGFTREATVPELAALNVTLVHDIGSGLLAPHPLLPGEPDAATSLAGGANLVTASGDKLLGGPQAGLLLGNAEIIARLRRHPLARALRVDKLTLAALQATITGPETPTWQALRSDPGVLRERTDRVRARLVASGVEVELVESVAVVGGGGAPEVTLASWSLALPGAYAETLRTGTPAVVGRVERGRLLLDLRCVPPEADDALATAVERACTS